MKTTTLRCALGSMLCLITVVSAQTIPLPTSKQIAEPVPGSPQRLNNLPMTAAWSPDRKYLALVNAGYGSVESDYEQSVAIVDNSTGKLADYPIELTDMQK